MSTKPNISSVQGGIASRARVRGEWVESIFRLVPAVLPFHSKTSAIYPKFDSLVKEYFAAFQEEILDVEPFKGIIWPRLALGQVSTFDFLTFDELILFSFYSVNRAHYRHVADLGANVGLHSIMLSRFGYDVTAFEPDPKHYEHLVENLKRNGLQQVRAFCAAVSDNSGLAEFVRVKGNTTASHLAGSRGFYGEIDRFDVKTIAINEISPRPDLLKLDVEGHEKKILLSIEPERWKCMDAILEVHSPENRDALFEHFKKIGVNLFSQKIGWRRVQVADEMPSGNKEGNLFISCKPNMPWGLE